jgi:HlyD family secretion protein
LIITKRVITGDGTQDQKTEFEVKIAITGPSNNLRPGMTASAEIVTDVRESCLSVPIQSVAVRTLDQLGGGGDLEEGEAGDPRLDADGDGFVEVVWVIAGDLAEARQVETGIQSESHIEITAGLDDGEQVVVGSYRTISRELEDGAAI